MRSLCSLTQGTRLAVEWLATTGEKPFDSVAVAPSLRALDSLESRVACHERAKRVEWTCGVGQRTEFHLPLSFTISTEQSFIHQAIASDAVRLRELGWSYSKIARELGVTDKTAKKAVTRNG